ncbi:hypothetical protein GOBAR_AA32285 [Gossypium barbadense]|uniref:Uncharacterized protein n=1 Tax=Gossypium barbadense TaxID=3634 RepID=A0A2P5WBF1_GOSBA|nr:hypothetical protein GOBAR_AA32285 [Gossypium barbadense]
MLTLNPGATVLQSPNSVRPNISFHFNIFPPFSTVKFALRSHYASPKASFSMLKAKRREEDISSQPFDIEMDDEYDDDNEGYEARSGFRGREEEKNYDKDPEFAEILGSCLDDPEKARSKMEDRLRKKRNKILHKKTGSGTPMKLSQSPLEKRPSYNAIQGANVNPTTFYNIGDLEVQDNLARIWVDIGTTEPLILDVLINALTQISSDYIGIKQLVFGGSELENWKESLTTEDAGYSVHRI